MKKIVIIGSPDAGKTTLAKDIGRILKIKVYYLDRLFWISHWQPVDKEARIDILQKLVQRQWIIEGTYLFSSLPRLDEADTIIFLDTSHLVCLWRVIKRHHRDHGRSRCDIPEGCVDKLTVHRILKVLSFPLRGRRILMHMLRKYDSNEIIWLRSNKDIEDFLRSARKRYLNQGIAFSLVSSACSNEPNLLSN